MTFTFAVTNTGNTPLTDVTVTDDRCAPVTRVSGDDQLDPGETWNYTCSKQIAPGHKIGDENPIRNVATATGKDTLGKTVTSTDDHLVRVLHPAVDIEKTGPATARAGNALEYTLTVTNPGDVPFAAQDVVVTDPRCEAPPAGPDTGTDATPGQLDPGDTWTYWCVAQTAGQPAGTFVNTATVTARDFNGRQVTDTDEFPTLLEEQAVLPGPEIVSGRARLRGPSGCVQRAVHGDRPRPPDRAGHVLPRRQADQDDQRPPRPARLQRADQAGQRGRHPPRHRADPLPGGVAHAGADAAAELPALPAPGRAAAVHGLT